MDYLNYKNAFKVFRLPLTPYEVDGEMVDLREQLPQATCAMLILQGYAPYLPREGKPHLSAYYVASNRVYQVAVRLAQELDKEHNAVHAKLRLKPFMNHWNIGRPGINTLIGTEGLGTYFSAQVVLTDAFEAQEYNACDRGCMKCMRCARACPTKAITAEGFIKEKCIRYYLDSSLQVPDEIKDKMTSMLGCDICQLVCPRNAAIKPYMMPEELDRIFTYYNILCRSGKLKDQVTAAVGSNMRPRVRPHALILAAKDEIRGYDVVAQTLMDTKEGDAARYYMKLAGSGEAAEADNNDAKVGENINKTDL